METSKDILEAETHNISRLHNSSTYRNNLTKILDFFHNRQTHLDGTLNWSLQACEFGKKFIRSFYAALEGILYLRIIFTSLRS
jgi:hypothetical protein